MTIQLEKLGKRYRYEWIFKELNYTFEQGKGYAIMGGNGSGKSTLMQVLSGYLSPSKGSLLYQNQGKEIPRDEVYQQLSFAAPYIESLEDFTLQEAVDFHWNFKAMHLSKKDLLTRLEYPKSAYKKAIKFFSSGMQQRLKLALAICSKTNLLLLDEPTITLDQAAVQWYLQLLQDYAYQPERLTIIASNVEEDFTGCQERVTMLDYK
ncbi:MAG: ATP-binding cassette domain-containing protein [Aureispira sp.]